MNAHDLLYPLIAIWTLLKDFTNSNFASALIGSGAGAWAGAAVVQRIIEKERSKAVLLNEIKGDKCGNRYINQHF